jgi:hypothetical protein
MSTHRRKVRMRELKQQFPDAFAKPVPSKAFRTAPPQPSSFITLNDRWPWIDEKRTSVDKIEKGIQSAAQAGFRP